ncbi:MAG: PTS sugar transporter subunit IIA [Planctomycetota bacterium]|jgi:PTS system nitrogen regulatory IIA component
MSHEVFTLEELAKHLGRDRRELEKLVSRGRMPGRKVGGTWQFHSMEITRWLEKEMREYSSAELRNVEVSQDSTTVCDTLPVTSIMHADLVQVPLQARTRRSVLESMIEVAGRTWQVWSPADILSAVLQREELFSTAYPGGVAIPHPRNPLPEAHGESLIAFGRTFSGIPFGAASGGLTDLFFLVLCHDSRSHLRIIARLGRMFQLPGFLDQLRECDDSVVAFEAIRAADEEVAQSDRP